MIFWLVESLLYLCQYKMSAPVVISVVVRHHISCLHVPRIKLGATPTHVDLQNRFSFKLVKQSKLFLSEGPFGPRLSRLPSKVMLNDRLAPLHMSTYSILMQYKHETSYKVLNLVLLSDSLSL